MHCIIGSAVFCLVTQEVFAFCYRKFRVVLWNTGGFCVVLPCMTGGFCVTGSAGF